MQNYVVMGVSGCGKSSVGTAVAHALGGQFIDGDDLHPPQNIAKMAQGQPLTDADRAPWLEQIGQTLCMQQDVTVIACSALKRRYRDIIRRAAGQQVTFLHLSGTRQVIESRMAARTDHFMPLSLLDSQFAALQQPSQDERAITVDIDQPFDVVVAQILTQING
ncbi:gluconokinase [Monaibacterium marinum]|uniref:Gluconokinase n=1 Tax=Pontivivens marinum TaxID=1690039 RepID=A0A2C9CVZ0_9RHOB|nr:gluconokinase [Monaibacterium marinum]SOH95275.1 gluconokinase [Monaibacterium marinum]